MIKFKKTKRDELRTNTKDIGELTKVVEQLITIAKSQQEQIQTLGIRLNELKTTVNKHTYRSCASDESDWFTRSRGIKIDF